MEDRKIDDTLKKEKPEVIERGKLQTACRGVHGYEIRVKDHLETYWHKWFEGWSVTNLENGEFLLKSTSVDQSRLHGTLNKVRDLNLTLLGVRCIPANEDPIG